MIWARRVVAVTAACGLMLLAMSPYGRAAAAGPRPRPDEWWFSTWSIEQKIWPVSEGSGVTVAVLDTGVQADVPDLAGVVGRGGNVGSGGGGGRVDLDTKTDGHGTAMSVLIAGQGRGTGMVGIAPRARIMPVVVDTGGAALTMSAGIRFAVDHGANVINMSQGTPGYPSPACDTSVQRAVAYAVEHDVVLVASAGDTGNLASDYPQWPAACAGVLAVGGIEPNGAPWPDTQRQSYVDVAAPGDRVGWSGKDGRYIPNSYGTSASAALVSGAAALIRSRYPSMPARQVVQRLINTTVPLGRPVPNDVTGYGLVDIYRALNPDRFPVAANAPNPPFAAYDRWAASPEGRQAGAAGTTRRRRPAAAARLS
jgi:membrane-anchored mycosin MYCP